MSGSLAGRSGIVFGASSKYSIGFHVAKTWSLAGAKVVLACETEKLQTKLQELLETDLKTPNQPIVVCCDVNNDAELETTLSRQEFNAVFHSVAFAPTNALKSPLLSLKRQDFIRTMETSAYSLLAVCSHARFPKQGGSVTAMTFSGGSQVVKGYGVMAPAKAALESISKYLAAELGPAGVRVNCISAGPIRTPAARVLPAFPDMSKRFNDRCLVDHQLDAQDVASLSVFLASDASKAVTGQVLHVDCGASATI